MASMALTCSGTGPPRRLAFRALDRAACPHTLQ